MKNILLYNVGPLTSNYAGVHTYCDVLLPFVNELYKNKYEVTWAGMELENKINNAFVNKALKSNHIKKNIYDIRSKIKILKQSPDVNIDNYDLLFLQVRPKENKIETFAVNELIRKFLCKKKQVFVWQQDLFDSIKKQYKDKVILLRPTTQEDKSYEKQYEFDFFTWNYEKHFNNKLKDKKLFDFCFIGNIYEREEAFKRFFKNFNIKDNFVAGNWISNEKKRKFSNKFKNLKFIDITPHYAAIPLMNMSKYTIQILPEFAAERGLATARVFTSQIARTLCFCDKKIKDAEKYFPEELIVKNFDDMSSRIRDIEDNDLYNKLLDKRAQLLKHDTVEERVKQFGDIIKENEK